MYIEIARNFLLPRVRYPIVACHSSRDSPPRCYYHYSSGSREKETLGLRVRVVTSLRRRALIKGRLGTTRMVGTMEDILVEFSFFIVAMIDF